MPEAESPEERAERFFRWERPAPRGGRLGSGNYGTVYSCSDGSVVKQLRPRRSGASAALAYREHVVSLLQSALVLQALTPHLPLHYGFDSEALPLGRLELRLYQEAFDCSLDAAPAALLAKDADWLALLFQLMSAVVCVARLLDLCHNDVYPRNVLLRCGRPGAPGRRLRYHHFGADHELAWHSLAALTDFGVCSSPLLASPDGPEVRRPRADLGGVPFGDQAPRGKHVLAYRDLPPFSRDPYMLFKWARFPCKGLPAAPEAARAWARHVLAHMDQHLPEFGSSAGTVRLLHDAFAPAELERHGLPGLRPGQEPAASFSATDADRARVLQRGAELLRAE